MPESPNGNPIQNSYFCKPEVSGSSNQKKYWATRCLMCHVPQQKSVQLRLKSMGAFFVCARMYAASSRQGQVPAFTDKQMASVFSIAPSHFSEVAKAVFSTILSKHSC
jgi:hypothetical protein